jgi:hypothetical protein
LSFVIFLDKIIISLQFTHNSATAECCNSDANGDATASTHEEWGNSNPVHSDDSAVEFLVVNIGSKFFVKYDTSFAEVPDDDEERPRQEKALNASANRWDYSKKTRCSPGTDTDNVPEHVECDVLMDLWIRVFEFNHAIFVRNAGVPNWKQNSNDAHLGTRIS